MAGQGTVPGESRGHLNPSALAPVARLAPPPDLADALVHVWIPEWDLPAGQVLTQAVLTYPVVNLVVQPGAPEGDVALHGPRTAVSHRDLSGRGWAVGALLRPAAVPALLAAVPGGGDAAALVDASARLEQPRLLAEVAAAMRLDGPARHQHALGAVCAWLRERLADAGAPDADGLLANALLDVVASSEDGEPPRRVDEVAARLGVSVRTAQRLSLAHTGFTPTALLRRRRLQHAADRLRRDPTLDLAGLAHDTGYADHAHLTRDFRAVLGLTPSDFRAGAPVPPIPSG
ncbi:MAG: helix-turn-helix domain-containing protein [Motilibacteraceae bacterium]